MNCRVTDLGRTLLTLPERFVLPYAINDHEGYGPVYWRWSDLNIQSVVGVFCTFIILLKHVDIQHSYISLYLSSLNQPKPIQITCWCSAEISTFNHMHVIDHTDLDKLFKVTHSRFLNVCERSCDSFVHVSCVEIVLINVTENHSSAVLWAGIIIQLVRSCNVCFNH